MKFTITETVKKSKVVDLELPRYSVHRMDHSTSYRKLFKQGHLLISAEVEFECSGDGNDTKVSLSYSDIAPAWNDRECDFGGNTDWYLGLGEFDSDEDEWNRAVGRAHEAIGLSRSDDHEKADVIIRNGA